MSEFKETNGLKTKVEGQDLIIERIFHAPRHLVFQAFSKSEQLASWWGPKGWKTENREFTFEPNGVWHYGMRCDDQSQGDFYGMESWGKAVFREIVPLEKIVYVDSFSDEEGNKVENMPEMLITLTFVDQDDQTKLIMRNQFASIETLQQVMDMGVVEGVASQMTCLDDHLEEKK
jgi:uncharacterized protein YndB with AHSA1/START domain